MNIDSDKAEDAHLYCWLEWMMAQGFRGQCVNTDQNKDLYDLWPNDSISRILFPVHSLKFRDQDIYKSTGHYNKKHKLETNQMPNYREVFKQLEYLNTVENYIVILDILQDYFMIKRIHNSIKYGKQHNVSQNFKL